VISILFRLDMSRVECRHAFLRRFVRSRGGTWLSEFASLSADWFTARSREMERDSFVIGQRASRVASEGAYCFPGDEDGYAAADENATGKKKIGKRKGGGTQRAFLSKWFRTNRRDPSTSRKDYFLSANQAYRDFINSDDADLKHHFQQVGERAKEAVQLGGAAFGPRLKPVLPTTTSTSTAIILANVSFHLHPRGQATNINIETI
jgi:hypothetical protein